MSRDKQELTHVLDKAKLSEKVCYCQILVRLALSTYDITYARTHLQLWHEVAVPVAVKLILDEELTRRPQLGALLVHRHTLIATNTHGINQQFKQPCSLYYMRASLFCMVA